jgi:hypothetical protein
MMMNYMICYKEYKKLTCPECKEKDNYLLDLREPVDLSVECTHCKKSFIFALKSCICTNSDCSHMCQKKFRTTYSYQLCRPCYITSQMRDLPCVLCGAPRTTCLLNSKGPVVCAKCHFTMSENNMPLDRTRLYNVIGKVV